MDLLRGSNTKKYTKREENDYRSQRKTMKQLITLNENTFHRNKYLTIL